MAGDVKYNIGTMKNPPAWSVGDGTYSVKFSQVEALLDAVPDRYDYALIVTGFYSQLYPGHEDEEMITLSYKVNTDTMIDELENENHDTVADWVNSFMEDFSLGYWEDVTKLYLVDRPDITL